MAFTLYAKEVAVSIDHSEELLFLLASENTDKYPELCKLWVAFYDNPILTDEQSGRLVHELIELQEFNSNAQLSRCFGKLLPFFSRAYKNSTTVRCSSD